MNIVEKLPTEYTHYWTQMRNVFICLGVGIILSNLLVAASFMWVAMRLFKEGR